MSKQRDPVTCAYCNDTFTPEWTEEEATAEAAFNFPGMPKTEMELVCTECFTMIMEWARKEGLHK